MILKCISIVTYSPYYDTLYTLEKLSQNNYVLGVIANGKSKIKQFRIHSLGLGM